LPFFKDSFNFAFQSLLNRCDFIQKRGEIGLTEPLATMNENHATVPNPANLFWNYKICVFMNAILLHLLSSSGVVFLISIFITDNCAQNSCCCCCCFN